MSLHSPQFEQPSDNAPKNECQTLVLNRALDGMQGKFTNAKWAATAQCSAGTALRDITGLLALGVLDKLESGGRNTVYALRFSAP